MSIELPAGPGTYVLELHLPAPREVAVGRLGAVKFAEGWYYYAGSALRGLRGRLLRHLRTEKVLHWHIDALREHAEITSIYTLDDAVRRECEVAEFLAAQPRACLPVPRFGSSDCRCQTHLIWLAAQLDVQLGPAWQRYPANAA